jgi:uncharacterized protein YqgV (UPF0045/DUF77 family)
MITAEVAVYPLKTNDATNVINNCIGAIKDTGVNYSVNSMSTILKGSETEVFDCLRTMFTEAERNGVEVSMVATIVNSAK